MPEIKVLVGKLAVEMAKIEAARGRIENLYRSLGEKADMSHHLRPRAVAALMDKPELPDIPPEIYARRSDPHEKIGPFLRRVYARWIGKGFTRNRLRTLDKSAYAAFKNHLAYHGDIGDLDLPSVSEQINRDFEALLTFDNPVSRKELDTEIILLRRIHNFLKTRGGSEPEPSPSKAE